MVKFDPSVLKMSMSENFLHYSLIFVVHFLIFEIFCRDERGQSKNISLISEKLWSRHTRVARCLAEVSAQDHWSSVDS